MLRSHVAKLTLLPVLAIVAASCGPTRAPMPASDRCALADALRPSWFVIEPAELELERAQSAQLTLRAFDDDGAVVPIPPCTTWSTLDPAVAVVNAESGIVRAVNGGVARIRVAWEGGVEAQARVIVGPTELAQLSIDPPELVLMPRERNTVQLHAWIRLRNGITREVTDEASWTSSSASSLPVSDTPGSRGFVGPVHCPLEGSVQASYQGHRATVYVRGWCEIPPIVTIEPAMLQLPRGVRFAMRATGHYSELVVRQEDLTTQVRWSSLTPAVLSVDERTGVVRTVGTGRGRVQATYATPGWSDVVTAVETVVVRDASAAMGELGPASWDLLVGESQRATAHIVTSDHRLEALDLRGPWSSSDEAVAAVTPQGEVTARAPGTARIELDLETTRAWATVRVRAATAHRLVVHPAAATLLLDGQRDASAILLLDDGRSLDRSGMASWTGSGAVLARPPGVVSTFTRGDGEAAAEYRGQRALMSTRTVDAMPRSFAVDPAAGSFLGIGDRIRFEASARRPDGVLVTDGGFDAVTFFPYDLTVANLGEAHRQQGFIVAWARGRTTMLVRTRWGEVPDLPLEVPDVRPVRLDLSLPATRLPRGLSAQARGAMVFATGATRSLDDDSRVVWLSSRPEVVLVSNLPGQRGRVFARSAGTARLTAWIEVPNVGSVTGELDVSVTEQEPVSLTLTAAPERIDSASPTASLRAAATFADGSTHDVSHDVSLTSSDPARVYVIDAQARLVPPASSGDATVTATLAGVRAETNVRVGASP